LKDTFNKRVIHLTSVHPRYDTRIFFKECLSLSKAKYCVHLVVADGLGDTISQNIHVWDVGKPKGRTDRIKNITKSVLQKALVLEGDIYHLHDPELIPIGIKLKKKGKQVIFDIHENIALQIKNKIYLPRFVRFPLALGFRLYEQWALRQFDALIMAEDSYWSYYQKISLPKEVILNLPDVEALKNFRVTERNEYGLFYIGGISNERGLDVTVAALKLVKQHIPDIYMHYIGNVYDNILETLDIEGIEENIRFYGAMPLYEGMMISQKAAIGLSILKPIDNYKHSYSTKVFEYMAIGLPVITSDFPLYQNIVEKYQCGICVNPEDPEAIAKAILSILADKKRVKTMGKNGIQTAENIFSWEQERKKLLSLYRELLS